MKKMIILGSLIAIFGSMHADWLNDFVTLVKKENKLNVKKAQEILAQYLKKDQEDIVRIEKKLQNQGNGYWATIHYGTYKAELFAKKAQHRYHKRLLTTIVHLPENQAEAIRLNKNLRLLEKYENELTELKSGLKETLRFPEQIQLYALIAAKQTQISAQRSFIKSLFAF